MHLIPKDTGQLILDDDLVGEGNGPLDGLRRSLQMVFQDSSSSLNPRLPIEQSIAYGPRVQGASRQVARQQARSLMEKVGLNPNLFGQRYAHELSGGQKQRVNIARALALDPRLLILDEAVSALDKSVEAQVLNLLGDIKKELKLTYIFISHDLHVVRYISDRVMVMYLGQLVEIGPVDAIYGDPKHPYTQALLACRLNMDPHERVDAAPLPATRQARSVRPRDAGSTPAAPMPRMSARPRRRGLATCSRCRPSSIWRPATWSIRDRGTAARLPLRPPERQRGSAMSQATSPSLAQAGPPPAPLVRVDDLRVRFVSREAAVRAVNGISFDLERGKVLCVIGESGSGKSVMMRSLRRLQLHAAD